MEKVELQKLVQEINEYWKAQGVEEDTKSIVEARCLHRNLDKKRKEDEASSTQIILPYMSIEEDASFKPKIEASIRKDAWHGGGSGKKRTVAPSSDDVKSFVEANKNEHTFGENVFKIMDKHGVQKNSQVYGLAMMRRQDFSRVTGPKTTHVTKPVVWQIVLGLQCTLEEADELLSSAGYTRTKSPFDLTMQFFIEHGNYDIWAINEILEALHLKPFSLVRSVKDRDAF